ncbi:MAG: hypothetical protein O3B24_06090 [Verrucomicrobia bacterium]|nr:hypothetical protein [Verrucomicrobiota bacterium]
MLRRSRVWLLGIATCAMLCVALGIAGTMCNTCADEAAVAHTDSHHDDSAPHDDSEHDCVCVCHSQLHQIVPDTLVLAPLCQLGNVIACVLPPLSPLAADIEHPPQLA